MKMWNMKINTAIQYICRIFWNHHTVSFITWPNIVLFIIQSTLCKRLNGFPGLSTEQGIFCYGNTNKKPKNRGNQGNMYAKRTREHSEIFMGNKWTKETFPREYGNTEYPPPQETLRYKDNHRNMLDVISIDEKRWWKLKDEMISEGY